MLRELAVVPALVATLFGSGADRHLGESDYGRTIHVHRGATIAVRLPNSGSGGYLQPQSSDERIVRRTTATGGYPTADDARATFVARHRGTADLTATTDYACLHANPPCEIAQREWVVHVVVRR